MQVEKIPMKFLTKFLLTELCNKDIYCILALYLTFENSLLEIILGIILGLIAMNLMIFTTNYFYSFRIINWKVMAILFTVTMFVLVYTG